jgi:hypothetical protein
MVHNPINPYHGFPPPTPGPSETTTPPGQPCRHARAIQLPSYDPIPASNIRDEHFLLIFKPFAVIRLVVIGVGSEPLGFLHGNFSGCGKV